MTNVAITPNQTRGECPEVGVWNCTENINCPPGDTSFKGRFNMLAFSVTTLTYVRRSFCMSIV
jgi:hypothetical protein